MLNPNDIANMKFDRSMGRGYRSDVVDLYLRQVADEFKILIAEKQETEQKLMVLAEKLEEYKIDEESMRSALIGAQKLGDSVIRDAKMKASMIIDEANANANRLLDNAKRTIEREKSSFVRMQREVATFKSKLQLVYKQHLELIRTIPVNESLVDSTDDAYVSEEQPLYAKETVASESLLQADPVDELNRAGSGLMREDELTASVTDEESPYEEDASLEYDTVASYAGEGKESRFGPLKFGKEYDIKRDDRRKK